MNRKTLFIGDKQCFSIEKYSFSLEKIIFRSKNRVYRSINSVRQIEKQSFLINSVFRSKNIVFLKSMFFVDKLFIDLKNYVFLFEKTMFFRNSAFHSINWVFRDKLCFSSEKQCFSIEKHCLSAISSVFRFITHLACHTLYQQSSILFNILVTRTSPWCNLISSLLPHLFAVVEQTDWEWDYLITYMPRLHFQKSRICIVSCRRKIHHFFFILDMVSLPKIFAWRMLYMLMYSALHIMQWFSLDVFTSIIRRKSFDLLWIKTNVAYTRPKVIATAIL